MVSREMAQDKTISPKAKGILLYLLSLPKNWKIFHSQLMDGLGIGEESLNSGLEELITSGYADRTRVKIKGMYQPYKYHIREFKKSLPNGVFQPGSSSPDNPVQQSKDTHISSVLHTEENNNKQGAAPPDPAVAVSSNNIHICLKPIEIPDFEKVLLSQKYSEEVVKSAIDWTDDQLRAGKIKTTYVATLKFACEKNIKPQGETEVTQISEQNIDQFDGYEKNHVRIDVLSKTVEFIFLNSTKIPQILDRQASTFDLQFKNCLKQYGFLQ